MKTFHLDIPLEDQDIEQLSIGDLVYLSGPAFTCRSRLQRYIFDEGHTLPFATKGINCLIHVGPIVIKEDGRWKLVSFMPTSSIRFEKWGALSVKQWDLKMIVGKTTMGEDTAWMMQQKKCVHVSPQCVSPNLWVDSIRIKDVHLIDELGSIEAAWHLELDQLGPFVVDIDCRGNNLFNAVDEQVQKNKKTAYDILNIPQDFEYTKLY